MNKPLNEIDTDRNAVIARIKSALQRRSGKSWSVTGGRGTAWGWITIDAPPTRRTWRLAARAASIERNESISMSDSDAVEQLKAKLEDLERRQEYMKRVNKAHAAFKKKPASLEQSDLPEEVKIKIRNYVPQYSWEPHPIAPYQLTNLSANIRRVKQQLEKASLMKSAPVKELEGEKARLEDCPPENRVRLFFPGKPDEETRTRLKKSGFRWSPTIGAWQAYRHEHTLEIARREAGIESRELNPEI